MAASFRHNLFKKPDGALLLWLLAFVFLLPWANIQSEYSINSNVAWLTLCAQRLLDGGTMLADCYDTNPPLSILIYMPPVLLEQIASIPSYRWIFILGFALVLGGALFIQYFLNKFEWMNKNQSATLAITFLAAMLIVPGVSFADRDHLIAATFIPFVLCQLCITNGKQINTFIKYFVLFLGAALILVKPYYGLLPTLILLHRIYKTKSLRVALDADFIALAVSTLIYAGVLLTLHNDYITHIIADVLTLYAPYGSPELLLPKLFETLGMLVMAAGLYLLFSNRAKQNYLFLLILVALNSFLAFVLQKKGFTYHLFPAYAAIAQIFVIAVLGAIGKFAPADTSKSAMVNAGCIALVFLFAYTYRPPNLQYMTHAQYQDNTLTQTLKQHCDEPCSFFLTYDNMDIISQLSYYNPDFNYASRFPTFWFMPITEEKINNPNTPPDEAAYFKNLRQKYLGYVAQDMERYNPSVLILIEEEESPFHDPAPDFKLIQDVMANYTKRDSIEVDRAIFYKNTKYDFPHMITWNIYTLNNAVPD